MTSTRRLDDEDVDVYFAQHDIQRVVSDMLYELGYHRPEQVGPFLATFVDRRFELEGAVSRSRGGGSRNFGHASDSFDTLTVNAASSHPTSEEVIVGQMLLEIRSLRRKYSDFAAEVTQGKGDHSSAASVSVIAWHEFHSDYDRLLMLLSNSMLWKFCQRRLAMLRGLFEAHRALNAHFEEEEAFGAAPARVDGCVRVGRLLPPGRLMAFFQSKRSDSSEEAQQDTLNELLLEWQGRPPGPEDLTSDPDVLAPSMKSLKGLFSSTTNALHGLYLKEMLLESVRLLEQTSPSTGGATSAEYRLPLYPEDGAWFDLAKWSASLGPLSSRVRWVIQLPQAGYASLKARSTILDYGELLGNAFGPLLKLVLDKPQSEAFQRLGDLLSNTVAFEVSASDGGSEPLTTEVSREPSDWSDGSSPAFAYQLYHVWARLRGLNHACAQAKRKEFELRASASGAEGLACAYMLGANSVSGCASLASHAPLQYLFMLDRIGAQVSLCSQRSLGGVGEAGAAALDALFRSGVRVALCSEDPTVSHQGDDPLGQEFGLARRLLNLGAADAAELCRNSRLLSGFEALRSDSAEGDEDDAAGSRRVRERFRQARRREEFAFLTRLIPEKDQGDF